MDNRAMGSLKAGTVVAMDSKAATASHKAMVSRVAIARVTPIKNSRRRRAAMLGSTPQVERPVSLAVLSLCTRRIISVRCMILLHVTTVC